MTVWVVHPTEQDLTKALEWGEIRYITDRHIYVDQIGTNGEIPRENQIKMKAAADAFRYGTDYFLLIGDQLQLAAFSAIMAHYWNSFRVLRYDKKAEGYVPVLIQT